MKFKNTWLAAGFILLAMSLAYAGDRVIRYTYQGGQLLDLRSDGLVTSVPDKRANNSTITSATLPTTTTGSQYAMTWLPVYNVGSAVTQGDVLMSSNTGTAYVMKATATGGLTSIVGVAAESIAASSNGWMVPRGGGYAVAHTTGTVAIGDILISTSPAGYLTTNNSPSAGTGIATAMSAGTAAGGNTLVIMH